MPLDADEALIEPPVDSPAEFDATATPNQGPSPSSQSPETVQEPPGVSGEEDQARRAVEFAPQEFDERHREPFVGLVFLGQLIEDHTIWGHDFRICTPSHRERLQIGQVVKEFTGTPSEDSAWMAGMVAAYLVEIDGEPLPEPVVKKKNTALFDRYNWVIDNLHTPVINTLFDKCLVLDRQVREVLAQMGKA